MTFGTGGDQSSRAQSHGFDFQLSPSSSHGGGSEAGRSNTARRRRRGPDRGAVVRTVLILVLAVAVVAAAALTAWTSVQRSEAEVRADSAAYCADLATTPGVLEQPGFGWPNDSSVGLPATIEAITAYQARWQNLAAVGPPTIRQDLQAIATAAGTIATSVQANNTIDRPAALSAIQAVTAQTTLRAWSAKYCG